MSEVTIVIPNYNGLHFLKPCLESLTAQIYRDFEVLVVDNGSTDGSPEWLRQEKVPALLLKTNTGFSGAVNAGIRAAASPFVILLNNDTEADPRYVGELVRAISRSDRIFAVSSKMLQLSHKNLMDDAGDMYSLMGWAYQRGVGRSARLYNRERNVFSACAGAAIYRRSVFEEIGYFDEQHFAYLEDIDICFRAKLYGYVNRYCPTARVCHVGSGTSGSRYNSFKVRLAARNQIWLNYKNMPGWQLALNALPLALGMLVKYAFFKKLGFQKDYLQGIREGFAGCGKLRRVPDLAFRTACSVQVEKEMIAGTFLYIYEFTCRQLIKIKRNLM